MADGSPSFHRSRGRPAGQRAKGAGPRPLPGLFADGIWLCDCQPERMPASHFRVKKEGPNQGRWFYTCQKEAGKRCGFFLWDDESKQREANALLGNSKTEPGRLRNSVESSTTGTNVKQGSPAKNQKAEGKTPPPKARSTPEYQSADEEKAVEAAMLSVTSEEPKRPSGGLNGSSGLGAASLKTPTINRVGGLVTPTTHSTKGSKRKFDELIARRDVSPDVNTPTPTRFTDRLGSFSGTPSKADLDSEIFESLTRNSVKISPELRAELSALCAKTVLKLRGVEKGREISRLALKTKDSKIAELQQRIERLNTELEAERELVRYLRNRKGAG